MFTIGKTRVSDDNVAFPHDIGDRDNITQMGGLWILLCDLPVMTTLTARAGVSGGYFSRTRSPGWKKRAAAEPMAPIPPSFFVVTIVGVIYELIAKKQV